MAYNNGIITAPVSIYDVQRALGNSNTDLGTLCKASQINKWAKYKPVKYAKIGAMTLENREAANHGITNIPTWNNINKMATFWLLQDTSSSTNYPDCGLQSEFWKYNRPTGGSASPYRLSDFSEYPVSDSALGYYHMAEQPIKPIEDLNLRITANGQLVMVWPTGAQNARTLLYSDLFYHDGSRISLSGFYFTALLCRVNGTGTKYVMTDENQTAQEAIEQGAHCRPWFKDLSAVNSFLGGNVSSAQFYLTCCLCNQEIYDTFTSGSTTYRTPKSSLGSLTADKFVALFERQTVTISKTIASFPITNIVANKWTSLGNRLVYYVITITNTDPDVRRYYQMTIEIRDSNQNVIATKLLNGTSDYVDAGGTKTISDSVDAGQYYSGATHIVVTTSINPNRDGAMVTETQTGSALIETGTEPSPYD